MQSINKERSLSSLLKIAAALAVLCAVIMLAIRFKLALSHHTDLGGVEQNVIYSIQKLLFDGKIYLLPAEAPFSITQYTPVFHYICSVTAKVSGCNADDVYQLYVIGRTWNIIFNLLIAYFIFRFSLKLLKLNIPISIILGLGSFICVFRQGYTVRPDSMMDLTIIMSVYFFAVYIKDKSKIGSLITAVILSAVIIFIKQSGIQLCVILISFLIFTADWRGLKFAIPTFILSLSALLGLFYSLYGNVFFTNVIGGVANGIDTKWFFFYVFGSGFKIKILLPAVFVLFITFYKWNIFKGDLLLRLLSFAACATFVFASITILKSGSNVEYYYPFFLVSILLIAYFIFIETRNKDQRFLAGIAFVAYLSGVFVLNVFHQYKEVKFLEYDHRAAIQEKDNMAAEAAKYVADNIGESDYVFANLNDEALDDKVYGRRGVNNILFRNALIPQLDIYKSSNVKSGVLGYEKFEKMLRNGEVKYFIEGYPDFNFLIIPDLQKIKQTNFVLDKEIGKYKIYKLKQ